jgi:hypothetical protein
MSILVISLGPYKLVRCIWKSLKEGLNHPWEGTVPHHDLAYLMADSFPM